MDDSQDCSNQDAARWYARLRAPDCTAEERSRFEAWRASSPHNAAAYAAAERMSDALAKLATADPRLKAMVDQAASAGATLPDEPHEEASQPKPSSLTVTAEPWSVARSRRRRIARLTWAASLVAAALSALGLLTLGKAERASGADAARQAGTHAPPHGNTGAHAATDDDARDGAQL